MWTEKDEDYYKELSRRREMYAPLPKIEESETTNLAVNLLKDVIRSLEKADGQVVSLNTECLFRGLMNNTQTKITILLEPWVRRDYRIYEET